MSDDAAFNDLRDTLWYHLACRCEYCGTELDLSDIERVRLRDAQTWSRVAAERAIAEGWLPLSGIIGVMCPTCRVGQN